MIREHHGVLPRLAWRLVELAFLQNLNDIVYLIKIDDSKNLARFSDPPPLSWPTLIEHEETAQCIGLPPAGFVSHRPGGPKTSHALTFKLDHSRGAGDMDLPLCFRPVSKGLIYVVDINFASKMGNQSLSNLEKPVAIYWPASRFPLITVK